MESLHAEAIFDPDQYEHALRLVLDRMLTIPDDEPGFRSQVEGTRTMLTTAIEEILDDLAVTTRTDAHALGFMLGALTARRGEEDDEALMQIMASVLAVRPKTTP